MLSLLLSSVALAGWPSLSEPPSGRSHPRDAAIVVAIEDYTHVGDIAGARDNALDWYRYLTKGRGIPADRAKLLLDGQATREEIEAAIAAVSGDGGGTLWFVFIGHGAPSPNGQDGLLLDVDVRQTALSVSSRGISQSALVGQLESAGFSQQVAILDACFSGQGSDGGVLVEGLQPLIPSYSTPTSRAAVLSAGQSDEFAGPLPGLDRPAFSYLALGALRGWGDADGDGAVTASEVTGYAEGALQSVLTGRSQRPQHAGPDLSLTRGNEAGPDLVELRLSLVPDLPPPPPPPPPPSDTVVSTSGATFLPGPGEAMLALYACPLSPTAQATGGSGTAGPTPLVWKVNGDRLVTTSTTGNGVGLAPGRVEVSVRGLGMQDRLTVDVEAGQLYYAELTVEYSILGAVKSADLVLVDAATGESGLGRCGRTKLAD